MSEQREFTPAQLFESVRQAIEDLNAEIHLFPSPGWALSCYLGLKSPSTNELSIFTNASNDIRRGSVFASWGFLAAAGMAPILEEDSVLDSVKRLLSRDLFPSDQNSFSFRPIELLGVMLGIKQIGAISRSLKTKLRDFSGRVPEFYRDRPKWEKEVVSFACSLNGSSSEAIIPIQTSGDIELDIVSFWKVSISPKPAQEELSARALAILKAIPHLKPSLVSHGCLPFLQYSVGLSLTMRVAELLPTKGSMAEELLRAKQERDSEKQKLEDIRQRIRKRCFLFSGLLKWTIRTSALTLAIVFLVKNHSLFVEKWEVIEPYTWLAPIVVSFVLVLLDRQASKRSFWARFESLSQKTFWHAWKRIIPEIKDFETSRGENSIEIEIDEQGK